MTRDQKMEPLNEEQLTKALEELPRWEKSSEQSIARVYKFQNYLDGVKFAKQIGEYAQTRKHHPSIQIDYKKVTIEMATWDVGGVTSLDIEMVNDFNNMYEKN